MREQLILCALALGAILLPAAAVADDPNDPAMRTAEARARDRAIIRRLNQEQLAHVRQRDARYEEGWRAYRQQGDGAEGADYARRRADHDQAHQRYASDRRRYEQDMADWRRAVAACRAGNRAACDN